MNQLRHVWLFSLAWLDLLRFDFSYLVHRRTDLSLTPALAGPGHDAVDEVNRAVNAATRLYWKPVLCLQKSLCAVRLLRRLGTPAQLVIGYRTHPFTSHAWVEIDGHTLDESRAYSDCLRVLHVA
jgi:hypothetical protein